MTRPRRVPTGPGVFERRRRLKNQYQRNPDRFIEIFMRFNSDILAAYNNYLHTSSTEYRRQLRSYIRNHLSRYKDYLFANIPGIFGSDTRNLLNGLEMIANDVHNEIRLERVQNR